MVLKVRNIAKSYRAGAGAVEVLKDVSLDLAAGETLALTGESGSGKSTLLHVVGGLDVVDAGLVEICGRDVTHLSDAARAELRRCQVGVVFQQFNLIPSLTVAANIAFHARLSGGEDKAQIAHLSDALGLTPHLAKYPEALSGGQQQRVAIARTLAARPKLILADEPTGNLDEATADEVLEQMLRLVSETGAALMVVTHSAALATRLDRQLHLTDGRLS